MRSNKKIKVNYLNDLFWLQPSASSYIRGRQFGYMPFKTLDDLVKKTELVKMNFYFSFNSLGEKVYDFFNALYRAKGLKFRLGTEQTHKIQKEGFVLDDTIHKNLVILWDEKALKWIRKGYVPFYDADWYIGTFISDDMPEDKIIKITWIKKEFEIVQ